MSDHDDNFRQKAELSGPAKLDRLPPHSVEAEQGVLGCIMLAPEECLIECIEAFKGSPEVFYELRHRRIFETMLAMSERKEAVDLITLQQTLRDQKLPHDRTQLDEVGGVAYLAELPIHTPSAANIAHYLDIVRDKFARRNLIAASAENIVRAYNDAGDVDTLLDEAERDILAVGEHRLAASTTWEAKALVVETSHHIEKCIKAVGVVEIPTGFAYMDRLTGGLHRKEMFVLAGRPSAGKTSLAMNIAENISMEGRKAVGVLSLEMSAEQLMMRMMCSRARVNFHTLRTGFPDKETMDTKEHRMGISLATAGMKIGEANRCYIDDDAYVTPLSLRAKLRRMKKQYDIQVAILDYIQLVDVPGYEDNPVQAMRVVSKALKNAAKELNIAVIVLSQLNRESEKRGGRPRMSDLRESGAIEQDADFIGILFRKELDEEEESALREKIRDNPHAETELDIIMEVCKQRNGPTGDVFFRFMRWCMRFEDLQRPSKPDLLPDDGRPL